MDEKTITLILYSDNTISMPTAKSVGEARTLFAAVIRHAEELEKQINGLPLQPPEPAKNE